MCVCVCVCTCSYIQFDIPQDVLRVAGDVLEEVQTDPSLFSDTVEVIRKLKQTKEVLVK